MSDTTTTPTDPAADGQTPAPVPDESSPAEGQGNDDREAAKYRRKLRDAEAERDTLRTRLETLQRTEAERLAGEHLADGSDLWRDGAELAGMLDDDGNVSAEKVTAAATQLSTDRPHWRKPVHAAAPASDVTGNQPIDSHGSTRSWADVLGGSRETA